MHTKLIKIVPETADITSFHFEKPANFSYLPGQFVHAHLPQEKIAPPHNTRHFSLSSSPTESDITITLRHGTSEFKKHWKSLRVGDEIEITGPFGKFVLNEDVSVPAVFLTGGIGITPFHSMIKYATDKNLAKKMTVIYSNKTTENIPFKEELDQLDKKNTHLSIYHTLTQANPTAPGFSWIGRHGRINADMIAEIVGNIMQPEYYIVGPVKMVLELRALLTKQMNIPSAQVHFELFTGY